MYRLNRLPKITTDRWYLKPPFQHANNSTTCLDSTQETPNKKKTQSPYTMCIHAINKKMIHIFPTILAHTTLINNTNIPSPPIIQCKNISLGCCPCEKRYSSRSFHLPNASPWEGMSTPVHKNSVV